MSFKNIKEKINDLEESKKKINPYSHIIKSYDSIVEKEDIVKNTLFNNFILEIGCGSGRFLTQYAKANKDICLGIDIRFKRLVLAANKSLEINNLFWSRCRAEELVNIIKENSLKEVHIYFPDPWPKKRHLKNRLMSKDFLQQLKEKMTPKAKLFFKTDHDEYFEFAKENIEKVFNIEEENKDLYSKQNIEELSTEFENLFFHKEKNINFIVAVK